MDANLTTAIVTASATALVAIVAIVTNNRRLGDMNTRISNLESSINARFTSMENNMNARMSRLESKLDHIKELLVSYALDVARIKERLGM